MKEHLKTLRKPLLKAINNISSSSPKEYSQLHSNSKNVSPLWPYHSTTWQLKSIISKSINKPFKHMHLPSKLLKIIWAVKMHSPNNLKLFMKSLRDNLRLQKLRSFPYNLSVAIKFS